MRHSSIRWWAAQLGLYAITLWVVLTLNFLLPRLLPGDPISAMQDPGSSSFVSDEEARARLASYYHLDLPLSQQYVRYLGGIARGDLGWSIRLNEPVAAVIRRTLPWTLLLTVPALLAATAITVFAGAHAGWRRNSAADRALIVGFTGLRTVPVFFFGTLALLLFSARLGWLPLSGAVTPFRTWPDAWSQTADVARHWILPAALLTIEMIGGRFLLMRNSMVGVLGEDYMLVARAKGLSEGTLKYRHGVRNSTLPFFASFSAQVAFLVTGTLFIETLFVYPGMGRLMYESVAARDYPVLEGVFLVSAVVVLAANLGSELLYVQLDPRVRA